MDTLVFLEWWMNFLFLMYEHNLQWKGKVFNKYCFLSVQIRAISIRLSFVFEAVPTWHVGIKQHHAYLFINDSIWPSTTYRSPTYIALVPNAIISVGRSPKYPINPHIDRQIMILSLCGPLIFYLWIFYGRTARRREALLALHWHLTAEISRTYMVAYMGGF